MPGLSIRSRLALGHLVALSLALVLFSGILYFLYRGQLYSQLDINLRNDLEHADDRIDLLINTKQGDATVLRPENWLTEIWSTGGERAFASEFKDSQPLGAWDARCLENDSPYTTHSANGLKIRVFCQRSSMHREKYVLRVARLSENIELRLSEFLRIIGLAVPLVIAFSAIMGRLLAKHALDPIAEMTARARSITASSLTERLPVSNPEDELGRLAQAFNESFSGLERSFTQMRRFTADASHELRTPLTAIRALGEVALNSKHQGVDHREVISNVLEETDRLRSLCDSLLMLSRADAGQIGIKVETLDVAGVINNVFSLLSVLAEERQQSLEAEVSPGLSANADPALLKQAITNLVDNAIKYSPKGTRVRVEASRLETGELVLRVRDQGPGISKEHQSLVFERFYRIDKSRARLDGGAGLGLSIVKWIAELHRGSVSLSSSPGEGSTFEIKMVDRNLS